MVVEKCGGRLVRAVVGPHRVVSGQCRGAVYPVAPRGSSAPW